MNKPNAEAVKRGIVIGCKVLAVENGKAWGGLPFTVEGFDEDGDPRGTDANGQKDYEFSHFLTVVEPAPKLPRRIYVGGASRELERVERFIGRCKAAGYVITHDWTVGVRSALGVKRRRHEQPLSATGRRTLWDMCISGVAEADACVFLAPVGVETRGMWAEMGVSQSCGGLCVYVGHKDDTIATSMCEVVADDDAAFALLETV